MLGKQIGMVKEVTGAGRIGIPMEITTVLNWQEKPFEFELIGGEITACLLSEAKDGKAIDKLNRLVIPYRIRKQLGIVEGTLLEMYFYENGIKLTVWEGK